MSQTSTTATNGHRSQQSQADSKKTFREFLEGYLKETDIIHSKHVAITLIAVSLIILSIVTLILETDKEIFSKYGSLLLFIDGLIMVIFALEYIARIYIAAGTPPGTSPWTGVWKYVWSFYGLVDLAAVSPLFIGIFFPGVHVGYLRVFRLLRILMLGRYFRSFPLLRRAVMDKKGEILISLQVVAILTVILSVLMYEIEYPIQPDKFSDISTTLGWSVSKYIHDIAGLGDFKPKAPAGKFIATLIGFLAIALFAIPAGLIASGFVHEMDEEKKRKDIERKRQRINDAFHDIPNEHLGRYAPRKYITLVQAKSRLNLSEQDIITIAELHKGVRLRYKLVNKTDSYPNALLIEHYNANTNYGTLEKGESHLVTVVSPNSYDETSIGHFSNCLARMLDAAYISNELFGREDGVDPNVACSFSRSSAYLRGEKGRQELEEFKSDIRTEVSEGTLAIVIHSMRTIELNLNLTGNKALPSDMATSFGVLIHTGVTDLIHKVNNIEWPVKEQVETKPDMHEKLLFRAESFGRQLSDLHCFIQRESN